MGDRGRTEQQAERRALVADLVRAQAVLQARTEQLEELFGSRWYRLARLAWRLRRPWAWRRVKPPKPAGELTYARPLNGDAIAAERHGEGSAGPVRGLAPARGAGAPKRGPRRLLLAGHSLSFFEPLARRARARGVAVREDRWAAHDSHDEGASAAALAWADVVHCEWCLGNAVWYSREKRPGQRLVVRFHRMELDTPYPGEVDLSQVDAMVFVARHVLERACERWGWDPADPRLLLVPNGTETGALRQPKLPGAEFSLAMVGYVPRLKRLDRALDLLELLRARDERYRLLVKGREPWEHAWMAARAEERRHYEELLARLDRTPGLRDAVCFEPFGDDVPEFLRRAGWILSTSEVEGHSVSLAEGMASGAVPVVIDRPGAVEQYEERWVHAHVDAAAEAIRAATAENRIEAESEAAWRFAERWAWERLWPTWERLVLGPGASAMDDRNRAATPTAAPGG